MSRLGLHTEDDQIRLTRPLTLVGHDNVHHWAGAGMDHRYQARSHELDDVDPEMLVLHRVQADRRVAQTSHDLGVRRIDDKLNVVLRGSAQISAQ